MRALCYGGNGSIFLAVDKSGGGVTVYRLHESGESWQADEWTHGAYSACGGIGGTWDGTAWHLALSLWGGVPGTTGTSIMGCRTDGATWEALTPVARVDDSTAQRDLLNPTVERWEQAFRVAYLERDYGVVSGLNFGRWRYCTAHTWGTFAEGTPVEDESYAGFWWLRQDARHYWLINQETAHCYERLYGHKPGPVPRRFKPRAGIPVGRASERDEHSTPAPGQRGRRAQWLAWQDIAGGRDP